MATSLDTGGVDSVGGAGSAQLNSHHVGNHGALGIQPSSAANVAVPELDVTQLGAGGGLSINVDHVVLDLTGLLAANHADGVAVVEVHVLTEGDDGEAVHGHAVGIPGSATVGAVPVLDVTVDLAGSLNGVNVNLVVSSVLVGQLVAVHAVSIAGIEVSVVSLGAGLLAALGAVLVAVVVVLVLASGLLGLGIGAVDGDVGGHGLESHELLIQVDAGIGVEVDGQGIGAGNGIILDLEGSGVEQLLGAVALGGAAGVEHTALGHHFIFFVNRAESDVLIAGGVEGGADFDRGDISLFILIVGSGHFEDGVVIHDLSSDGDNAGVVQQQDFDFDLVTGISFFHGRGHNSGLLDILESSNGGERNQSTQHQNRQENC